MGSVVANGCHAYQVLKSVAHAKGNEGTVHEEEKKRRGTDLNGQAEGPGVAGETAN